MTDNKPVVNTNADQPRLIVASPLAGLMTIGYGVFNILLGLSLIFLPGAFGTSIASYLFSYHLWAVLFITSGVVLTYGFARNKWHLMSRWIVISFSFKMVWLMALIARMLIAPSSPIVLVLWGLLTYLQFVLYIHFPRSTYKGQKQ